MKTLSFLFLCSILLLVFQVPDYECANSYTEPVSSTYTSTLNADQVVDGSNSGATGTAAFFYNAQTEILSWRITHNVQNPLTADLHGPADIGSNAAVIIPFETATSPITGSQKISDANALHLMNDLTYVSIHTANNPLGAIRGQVVLAAVEGIVKGVANLDGMKNIPPVSTSATGSFSFTFSNVTQIMTWKLSHSVTNATMIHIHGPAPTTENAGVLVTFPSTARSSEGNFTLNEAIEQHLLNGLLYITVHSPTNPNGEIRGQIEVKSITLSTDDDNDGGLSGGEIFAIIFFVIVGVLVLAGLAYFFWNKRSSATGFSSNVNTRDNFGSYRKQANGGMNASLLDDAQAV